MNHITTKQKWIIKQTLSIQAKYKQSINNHNYNPWNSLCIFGGIKFQPKFFLKKRNEIQKKKSKTRNQQLKLKKEE